LPPVFDYLDRELCDQEHSGAQRRGAHDDDSQEGHQEASPGKEDGQREAAQRDRYHQIF
jgi:hypothetical protein